MSHKQSLPNWKAQLQQVRESSLVPGCFSTVDVSCHSFHEINHGHLCSHLILRENGNVVYSVGAENHEHVVAWRWLPCSLHAVGTSHASEQGSMAESLTQFLKYAH